jgi:hypothetical protein
MTLVAVLPVLPTIVMTAPMIVALVVAAVMVLAIIMPTAMRALLRRAFGAAGSGGDRGQQNRGHQSRPYEFAHLTFPLSR